MMPNPHSGDRTALPYRYRLNSRPEQQTSNQSNAASSRNGDAYSTYAVPYTAPEMRYKIRVIEKTPFQQPWPSRRRHDSLDVDDYAIGNDYSNAPFANADAFIGINPPNPNYFADPLRKVLLPANFEEYTPCHLFPSKLWIHILRLVKECDPPTRTEHTCQSFRDWTIQGLRMMREEARDEQQEECTRMGGAMTFLMCGGTSQVEESAFHVQPPRVRQNWAVGWAGNWPEVCQHKQGGPLVGDTQACWMCRTINEIYGGGHDSGMDQ